MLSQKGLLQKRKLDLIGKEVLYNIILAASSSAESYWAIIQVYNLKCLAIYWLSGVMTNHWRLIIITISIYVI